jgi:hypothetical protein
MLGSPDPSMFRVRATPRALGPTTGSDISMGMPIPFDWEIESMWAYIARWFITEQESPGMNMVGIMSSMRFCRIVSQFVDPALGGAFRRLICAASMLDVERLPFGCQSVKEDFIESMTHAGNEVLRLLEALLEPKTLAQTSRQKLGTIFIILVGTIIAIGYVSPRTLYPVSERRNTLG